MRDWRSLCGFRLGLEISNVTAPTRRTLHPFSVLPFFSSIDSRQILSKIKFVSATGTPGFPRNQSRPESDAAFGAGHILPVLNITAINHLPLAENPSLWSSRCLMLFLAPGLTLNKKVSQASRVAASYRRRQVESGAYFAAAFAGGKTRGSREPKTRVNHF